MSDIGSSTAPIANDSEQAAIARNGMDAFARAAALTVRLTLGGGSRAGRAFLVGISDAITTPPRIEYLANATKAGEGVQELTSHLEKLFRDWQELRFEDGMENDLSRLLWRLLMTHSTMLVEALASILIAEHVSPRVAAEALRHLGRFTHPPTHRDRLWLLGRALRSESPLGRDGAGLGLAHLDDPAAIGYLEAAIDAEPLQSLKQDLRQVLEGLQQTKDAAAR